MYARFDKSGVATEVQSHYSDGLEKIPDESPVGHSSVIVKRNGVITVEDSISSYKEKRIPEYPKLTEFADAYYWASQGDDTKMTEYLSKVNAVKAKYPKL